MQRLFTPSKLDPYKEIVAARLAEYPELSAVRLFEEVLAAGYPGGYGQVTRYVREVRPRPPQEPVQRFETEPGHQAQVDFAEFRFSVGQAVSAGRGAGLLAVPVASVLRASDDGGRDAGAGGGVRPPPRHSRRDSVRPDEYALYTGRGERARRTWL